tara:strand:+ start:1054 stop:1335 length:282 start_codon:yes stop_codon:yes gene_type:complete
MIVELTEIYGSFEQFNLRKRYINPEHVVTSHEDEQMKSLLKEGKLPGNIEKEQCFTKIHLSSASYGNVITVLGCPFEVSEKLNAYMTRRILHD